MKKDGYGLYRCANCGLIFVYPKPDKKYLSEEVYSPKSGYQIYKTKNLSETRLEKKTEKIFQYLERNNIKGKLLDVGCSSGLFLYHAEKRGFNSFGIELNKHTADIAKNNGLNVFCGTLEDCRFEDNFFKVISLGDILEHVPEPRVLLIECKRILRSGGYLIIATPNADCFWSKITLKLNNIFGIPWSTATPPHHLYQFSFYNLNLLLKELKLNPAGYWFTRPPALKYELGSLHLLKRFKKKKNISNFFYMLFAFSLYTFFYLLDIIITPFKRKDFSMVICCKKQ